MQSNLHELIALPFLVVAREIALCLSVRGADHLGRLVDTANQLTLVSGWIRARVDVRIVAGFSVGRIRAVSLCAVSCQHPPYNCSESSDSSCMGPAPSKASKNVLNRFVVAIFLGS
jgi:hypothetical protein